MHLIMDSMHVLIDLLTVSQRDLVAREGSIRSFAKDEIVFREGDPGEGLYFVTRGEIEISCVVGDAGARVLSRVLPGDFFGELAVVDPAPRSATARAGVDSELFFVPSTLIQRLLQESAPFASRLMVEVCQRVRKINLRFTEELVQVERLATIGRFARTVIHDLKNPLAIIKMGAELMGSSELDPGQREYYCSQLTRQADRMNSMIQELLEFTRGPQKFMIQTPVYFDAVVSPILEDLRMECADRKVDLVVQSQPPRVKALIEARRLPNVFFNLAHNAMDAMKNPPRQLILRFRCDERLVHTEIEDTGAGIPPEILPRLFQPFATFGKQHGTGLGLSICQRIIQGHGGTIEVSNAPGRGAVFHFSLPLAPSV